MHSYSSLGEGELLIFERLKWNFGHYKIYIKKGLFNLFRCLKISCLNTSLWWNEKYLGTGLIWLIINTIQFFSHPFSLIVNERKHSQKTIQTFGKWDLIGFCYQQKGSITAPALETAGHGIINTWLVWVGKDFKYHLLPAPGLIEWNLLCQGLFIPVCRFMIIHSLIQWAGLLSQVRAQQVHPEFASQLSFIHKKPD